MSSPLTWAAVAFLASRGGLPALALLAGYGVYDVMPAFYSTVPPGARIPAWSEPARVATGVAVTVVFAAVTLGLAALVRRQPHADRALVVVAWVGWSLFGAALAVGWSLWDVGFTLLNLHYRIHADWGVTRGLVVGLLWSAVALLALAAWRRGRTARMA